ncbi:hypothetical protein NO989_16840 [Alteromonas sp. DY56-G5]|jgi:hypothetical protein|uniref:hypothetical protein n=1 Tax=Alteromonas sp. DY56-G5 TaxID=2967128 RepID=UPI00352A959F|tara:strand:- start:2996 stop:3976 length:981 start_codon:yes stop_codon:yes gene_type:complete
MKLFLHVGPHKTGTTLIQKTMLDNQGILLQQGLFYPKRFFRIFGHHLFRDKLLEKRLSDEDVAFLEHTGKNVLLSSEDLISLSEEHFLYLKERLANFDIEVIYAWRRTNKKLFSIWQEYVKHGGQDTFFEYHFPHIARPATSGMLSPDVKLNMLARVFGKPNISIIDYDAAAKADNLLDLFCKKVGLSNASTLNVPLKDKNASNKSMRFAESELLRAFNCYFAKTSGLTGVTVRLAFNEHRERLDQQVLGELLKIIESDAVYVNADRYFIDQRSENILKSEFASCLLNYEENPLSHSFNISSQKWLVDKNASTLFETLAKQLQAFL